MVKLTQSQVDALATVIYGDGSEAGVVGAFLYPPFTHRSTIKALVSKGLIFNRPTARLDFYEPTDSGLAYWREAAASLATPPAAVAARPFAVGDRVQHCDGTIGIIAKLPTFPSDWLEVEWEQAGIHTWWSPEATTLIQPVAAPSDTGTEA